MCLCICFPSTTEVWTLRSGSHLIPELNPYEKIVTLDTSEGELRLCETRFYTYLHYEAEVTAEFLSIQCNGDELLISPDHLLFTGYGNPVSAKSIQIGDTLVKMQRENNTIAIVPVTNIERKTMKGIFAPLTKSGTLLANGFLVSCYAHVKSHAVAHATLAPLRLWHSQARKWRPGSKTQHSTDGIHKFAKFLLSASKALPKALLNKGLTSDLWKLEV